MDDPAEETVAVGRIFGRVEDMLMPELVQVILAFCIAPWHKHETRLHLQQSEKTDVFCTGCLCTYQAPALLFHERVAHRVQIEFFGEDLSLRGK